MKKPTRAERKPKKCRACGEPFFPFSSTQVACSSPCAITLAVSARQKKEAKSHRIAKKEFRLNDKGLQRKLTQAVVNKWVRTVKDADKPCISCGRYHEGQWHAGHYLSVGSHPHMRFAAGRNIHKQCAPCNNHKSGNAIEYRKGLVARYGIEFVESLEADKTPRKFTNGEVIAIGQYYKGMIKRIETTKGE